MHDIVHHWLGNISDDAPLLAESVLLAGLRLAPGGTQLTRTWIVYNKPKEPSYTHAGMLMGLGLTGAHLSGESLLIKPNSIQIRA